MSVGRNVPLQDLRPVAQIDAQIGNRRALRVPLRQFFLQSLDLCNLLAADVADQ